MITSVPAKKPFDIKFSTIPNKTLQWGGIAEDDLDIIKTTCEKQTTSFIINGIIHKTN